MAKRTPAEDQSDAKPDSRPSEVVELSTLTTEEMERLFSGETIRTAGGYTFRMPMGSTNVAGERFGTLITSRPNPLREKVAERKKVALKARQELMRCIDQSSSGEQVRTAIVNYDNAFLSLTYALVEMSGFLSKKLDEEVAYAANIPAGLASEMARAKARAKHKDTPAEAAKDRARELWPTANRNGWSAAKMHRQLVDDGHEVAFTTIQKWMPKLRKGAL